MFTPCYRHCYRHSYRHTASARRTFPTRLRLIALAFVASLLVSLGSFAEFREVMIPMRDGVKLATNISLPDGEGPFPIILSRTPYNKDGRVGQATAGESREQGKEFLAAGYAYVVQDVRGQFKSEGEYRAFYNDMDDGYDTIEWLAQQPFSNGRVAVYGASALGITANMAAMAKPPHLVAGYVIVAHGSAYHYSTHPNGAYLRAMVEDWAAGRGVARPQVPRPIIQALDDSWQPRIMANYFSQITIPMKNVGGWYDIFLQGNIDNFMGLQYQGGEGARGKQQLMMGAFGHGALRGNLKYPETAGGLRGNSDDAIRFFNHWVKGEDTGIQNEPAVRYFVMGDTFDSKAPGNEWRTSEVWPPKATEISFFLAGENKLVLNTNQIQGSAASRYVADPNIPIPTLGGNNLTIPLGPMDQREVSKRSDVVKFETTVLENPVEVVGKMQVELFVSSSAEDTDFYVKVIDVYPDGYEALIMDQGTRLRFRDGVTEMKKAVPGEVYKIAIDLWSTALVFNKGHKIAIHVQSSNFNRFELHSNTWEPVLNFKKDAVKATNVVHHSQQYQSRLVLPVTQVY